MARKTSRLTARTVASLKTPGRHADGGNLYLTISKTAGGLSKRWTFMFALAGRQREAGLGGFPAVTLAAARGKAKDLRALVDEGIDPLAAKEAASEVRKTARTFGQCADELVEAKRSSWRNLKHTGQWETTLATHGKALRGMPVDEITIQDVLAVLMPIWQDIPETASRLRGRIEMVLDFAAAREWRQESNPARWRTLQHILPKRTALSRNRHAALPYADLPAFIGELRRQESIPRLALEFLVLTAARSGEVLGARWDEIDLAAKIWVIPAARMKSAREHRVPLSDRAVAILARLAEHRTACNFVFPGRGHQQLESTSLRRICPEGVTVHGFRSSFRDFAGEETSVPREVAEGCLAHVIGNAVEQAYRRGDALEKRRTLMEAWAAFCQPGTAAANVVKLHQQSK
jgi:integrase